MGQFDTLDVSVQEEFEKYLQERGVDERVALFIPEYAEYKEQSVSLHISLFSFLFCFGSVLSVRAGIRQVARERQIIYRAVNNKKPRLRGIAGVDLHYVDRI